MEENTQMLVMPDESQMSFEECMDNLQHTRDYGLYLDTLFAFSKKCLIAASVNDNFGRNIPDDFLDKMHRLGFKQLKKNGSQRYVCVIEHGSVNFEASEEELSKNVFFESEISNVKLSITSKCRTTDEDRKIKIDAAYYFLRDEAESEIIINGRDYSMNCSGLNIVVYDLELEKVIDSSTYDFSLAIPTFFHKILKYDEKFFKTHFFLQQKYYNIWKRIYEKSYYTNQKLGIKEVENGIFLPMKRIGNKHYGGVCDKNFNFIDGSKTFSHNKSFGFTRHLCGSYRISETDLDYIDEEVIYGGYFYDHPGHLISECFSLTMWCVSQYKNSNIKIAVKINHGEDWWPECKMEKFFFSMQFFSAMGIPKERIIFVDKPTKFKKIIVPDQSFYLYDGNLSLYSFTNKYILPYRLMCKHTEPKGLSKVYFTKSKSPYSNFVGEDYFIDFFKSKGFAIIYPEEYTISEKAGILRDADEFITFNGTSQHYAVFCKPSTKITILQRDNLSILPSQTLMTEAAGINDIYIVNISLNFIHQNLYGNVNLIGITDEWIRYVKEVYGEDVGITKEDFIKSHMYEYLRFYPKYYLQRQDIYDVIKNFKALDMLRNISEVLLGEELDTNGLNLTTSEDILHEKCEQNTNDLDFLEALFHDVLSENRLLDYLRNMNCTSVSLLCSDNRMTSIFKDVFARFNIDVLCVCAVTKCGDIPDNEWELCKKSDLILGYNLPKAQLNERDGIRVTDVFDIITTDK